MANSSYHHDFYFNALFIFSICSTFAADNKFFYLAAFLLIIPLFMIDKPYFMSIELVVASIVFLVWMYFVKDPNVWKADLMNTIIFTLVGIMIHGVENPY